MELYLVQHAASKPEHEVPDRSLTEAGAAAARRMARIQDEVVECRACPRLVAHREAIAARRTRRFAAEAYWGLPVPSIGDPNATLLIVGLAPAAHGANRTGRMFTGGRTQPMFDAIFREARRLLEA